MTDQASAQSSNAFVEAWRTHDIDRLIDAMAPDIVLHSPMLSAPFRGRRVARDLYTALFAKIEQLEILEQSKTAGTETIVFRAQLGRRTIDGVDVIRYDPQGDIIEIRNFIRPLSAIGLFAGATGPGFARKRGRAAAVLTFLLTQPLRALFAVLDRVAPKLLPLDHHRE
ncbi:nuclear transport factor 2 family protein [Nocardia nova]|uniref:nuclear transport factor 2 family protein n=1 Tax=Nocardia nova TaxID=37330 RepID=UPI00340059C5